MSATEQKSSHVHPLRIYITVAAALLILTAVTVAVSFIHLGPYNLVVALTIATLKALLVALFFMHLLYDNKLYLFVFAVALITLGTFIILTLFDTMTRGDIYPEVAKPIQPGAVIYADSSRVDGADIHAGKH
jgi:cytochrome c oxidase subunit 4